MSSTVSEHEATSGRFLHAIGRIWGQRPAWTRTWLRRLTMAGLALLVVTAIPFGWTRFSAQGHLFDEANAPHTDVVLVLGAAVAPGGTEPMPFLKGRLDTAAALVTGGQAEVILVSGDASGGSGNETSVMTGYLTHTMGIDPRRVVEDPRGLDTYDSCVRAKDVYGVERALVVTQAYHLSRAVALCRSAGIDANGVNARCDGCGLNLVRNAVRDYVACTKAALDAWSVRPPAVVSDPNPAVTEAVQRLR